MDGDILPTPEVQKTLTQVYEDGVKAGQLEILRDLLEEVERLVVLEPVVSLEGHQVLSLDWHKYLELKDLINQKIQEIEK